jgi:hypothetical protein
MGHSHRPVHGKRRRRRKRRRRKVYQDRQGGQREGRESNQLLREPAKHMGTEPKKVV